MIWSDKQALCVLTVYSYPREITYGDFFVEKEGYVIFILAKSSFP